MEKTVITLSFSKEENRWEAVTRYGPVTLTGHGESSEIALGRLLLHLVRIGNGTIYFSIVETDKERKKEEKEKLLLESIDVLKLSVRSSMCLRNADILRVGDLVNQTETDLLKVKNLGRHSLDEIKEALGKHELSLKE